MKNVIMPNVKNAVMCCPSCGGRLPLLILVQHEPLACPHCNTELEPKRWTIAPAFLSGLSITIFGPSFLRSAGFDAPFNFLVAVGVGGGLWFALAALLVRYRVSTKPLSIFR